MFRTLVEDGATVFTVPSAFTRATGEAHWRTLMRARAIENLAYVIAPGQTGEHPDNRSTWGHSVIIDPWGLVLAVAPDRPCMVLADCDLAQQDRVRTALPSLKHRRL